MKSYFPPIVRCDVCSSTWQYDHSLNHRHPESEIGGVPQNNFTIISHPKKSVVPKKIEELSQTLAFEKRITLGEGNTPLYRISVSNSCAREIYIKDESKNPTGSFKDRGIAYLISDVIVSGKKSVAIPSTGNAAISLTHYARKTPITPIVFVPKGLTPEKKELLKYAQLREEVDLVASFEKCLEFCFNTPGIYTGFPSANLAYIEGLKTTAIEITAQLGKTPDWVVIPCGSGGNIVGIYEGFSDISKKFGLPVPRILCVQVAGADPITAGFEKRERKPIILNPIVDSKAHAIASDTCFNHTKIIDILTQTNGAAISVTDEQISQVKCMNGFEFESKSVIPAIQNAQLEGIVVAIGTAGVRQ